MLKRLNFMAEYLWSKVQGKNIIFTHYLRQGQVLDLGCGEGDILKKDPNRFFGLDANRSQVEKLQAAGLKAQFGSATDLPWPDNTFSGVYCSNLIEHLFPDDAYLMLSEVGRVLVVGGYLILITPTPKTIWGTFGHTRPYPPQALVKIFRPVSREKQNSLNNFIIEKYLYLGAWSNLPIFFLITTILANILPIFRGSYVIIIKKTTDNFVD